MTNCEKTEQFVCISCVDELRYSFVSHLSKALRRKGINDVVTYIDSDDQLSKESWAKVEKAKVSLMVLPGNCDPTKVLLDRFVKVLEFQRNHDKVVVPVLYGDIPLQDEWLSALDMRGLSPIHQSRECSDSKLVEEIVRDVYEKLFHMGRIGIYPKLLEIENMACKQPLGIRSLGIWGMPGIGKTTLAKAVFDQMSGDFEACCFIEDYDKVIHEKGLYRLLEEQFLKESPGADSTITKLSLLRKKLNNKRVLVILDDVHNPLVAEPFLRGFDWFCPKSLIIITTRDKQVLRLCRVNQIYEVQGLDENEALQLFLLSASVKDKEEHNLHHELSMKVTEYANGNPLALSLYGRELKGMKNPSEKQNAFLELKRCPPSDISNVVKRSYDRLSTSEKNIFLDIACFFNGEKVDYVTQLLEGCGFFPHVGIDVLVEKCLVTISDNCVRMHNFIQDVGREIINEETDQIEKPSRHWEPWSIKDLLEDNEHKANVEPKTTFKRAQGAEKIEGMFLDTSNLSFDIKPAAFDNLLNLRLLKIYCSNPEFHPAINFPKASLHSLPNELRLLHWENYPLQSLPQNFDPRYLVEINMPYSQLQTLWGGTKNLEMLRTIRLCHSQKLVDVDVLLKAKSLEVIDLQGCTSLQTFPATGQLLHLRDVNLSGCTQMRNIPEVPPNIETLHLQCTDIRKLPIVKPNGGELVSLSEFQGLSDALKLERLTRLMKSSSSCQDLGKLNCLELKDCSRLQSLPNMVNLELLKVLDLSGCSELETVLGVPRNLKELYLAGTAVREVPQLPQFIELLNAHSSRLRSLPNMSSLEFLKVLDLSGCLELETIQCFPQNLRELYLADTAVREVPQLPLSLEHLNAHSSRLQSLPNMASLELLKVLDLSGCSELKTIQGFPQNLKELYFADTAVREVPQLPLSLELLNAHGSTSLKSIILDSEKLPMHYTFSNFFDLSPQVVNDFLAKALTNVKHIPREYTQELNKAPIFSFCSPSHTNQNSILDLQPGSSVMTRLNSSGRNTILGFAMLVEVAFSEDYFDGTGFGISCICRWNNKEDHSHRIERNLQCWAPGKAVPKVQKAHMFVFVAVNMVPSTAEGNDPDIWADLVVFEFFPVDKQNNRLEDCTVTRCGVRVITAATSITSLAEISPAFSLDPMEVSGNEFEEVLRARYRDLQEMDKVLFRYIACLFNNDDVDLVAPRIARIDLDISSGLKVLANKSLIHVSSNGQIGMHGLLRKIGKEILHRESMLPGSSKDLTQDIGTIFVGSSLSNSWKYDVFLSFSRLDVRRTFLSHLLKAFDHRLITMYRDDEIRCQASSTVQQAIRESRIFIVVISEYSASSSWNLNELVEISKSKREMSQTVIPIFYGVEPLDVRKQAGKFGWLFEQTCKNKTEDEIQEWRRALIYIASHAGYDSMKWNNEAVMMEEIANDVSKKLNTTTSKDCDEFVGIEDHMSEMSSVLCLESESVRMVGIWGPSGIGKSTIARALHSRLACCFQCSIYVDRDFVYNAMENSGRAKLDDYTTMLHLQTKFLSEGVVRERLRHRKVLIILDDVDDRMRLDALVGDTDWFGPGSRIIVVTKDEGLLKSHGIDNIYQVDLPSKDQALMILCRSAFAQNYPPDGFMNLAVDVAKSVGNLPLGLVVLGSYLRGRVKEEWMHLLPRIKNSLYGEIEKVLRVAYDRLEDLDKILFLHIVCLFNYGTVEYVTRLLAESYLDTIIGLRSLTEKSLIQITDQGHITMYQLQQNLGREIVRKESDEPGKRRFLVNPLDICDVLVDNTGTKSILGISLDLSEINELLINEQGFMGMRNLEFLRFYTNLGNKEVKVRLPRGLDYLPRKLRLLHWEAFPMRCMPSKFIPTGLVELVMEVSKLEKLWSGVQPLRNLQCMSLRGSLDLREIPDLSYATSLKKLDLAHCSSLTMLPSSIGQLHKLEDLDLESCTSLKFLPTGINLESLKSLNLKGCTQLTNFPEISRNISDLYLDEIAIKEVPSSIEDISSLSYLSMNGCKKLRKISPNISKLKLLKEVDFSECTALTKDSWKNHPDVISPSLMKVDMSGNSFKSLPDIWTSIQPKDLILNNCRHLVSLPELPASLSKLMANNCESLESLYGSFDYPQLTLEFINCFSLNHQARKLILEADCAYAILPGAELPEHFNHRADGSVVTISSTESSLFKRFPTFKACIEIDSRSGSFTFGVFWSFKGKSDEIHFSCLTNTPSTKNHLIVFNGEFSPDKVKDSSAELNFSDVKFEFFFFDHSKEMIKIKECGIQLLEVSPFAEDSGKRSETDYGNDSGLTNIEETGSSKRRRLM